MISDWVQTLLGDSYYHSEHMTRVCWKYILFISFGVKIKFWEFSLKNLSLTLTYYCSPIEFKIGKVINDIILNTLALFQNCLGDVYYHSKHLTLFWSFCMVIYLGSKKVYFQNLDMRLILRVLLRCDWIQARTVVRYHHFVILTTVWYLPVDFNTLAKWSWFTPAISKVFILSVTRLQVSPH